MSYGVTPSARHKRAVAIIRVEPVVPRPQRHPRGDENGLVTGTADLEIDLTLVLELNFLVVETPRQEHQPVSRAQVVGGKFSRGGCVGEGGLV